jgi:hypothetical protein
MTKSCEPKPVKCAPPEHDKPCHPDQPDHPAHPCQPVNHCPPPDHNACGDNHCAALVSGHVGVDHAQADVSLVGCHDLVDLHVGLDFCHDGYHA